MDQNFKAQWFRDVQFKMVGHVPIISPIPKELSNGKINQHFHMKNLPGVFVGGGGDVLGRSYTLRNFWKIESKWDLTYKINQSKENSMLGQEFIFLSEPLGASLQRDTQHPDVPETGGCAHTVTLTRILNMKCNILTKKDITDQVKLFIYLINYLSSAKTLENWSNSGIPEIQRLLFEKSNV